MVKGNDASKPKCITCGAPCSRRQCRTCFRKKSRRQRFGSPGRRAKNLIKYYQAKKEGKCVLCYQENDRDGKAYCSGCVYSVYVIYVPGGTGDFSWFGAGGGSWRR